MGKTRVLMINQHLTENNLSREVEPIGFMTEVGLITKEEEWLEVLGEIKAGTKPTYDVVVLHCNFSRDSRIIAEDVRSTMPEARLGIITGGYNPFQRLRMHQLLRDFCPDFCSAPVLSFDYTSAFLLGQILLGKTSEDERRNRGYQMLTPDGIITAEGRMIKIERE